MAADRADFQVAIVNREQADALVSVLGTDVAFTDLDVGDTIRWDGARFVDAPFVADAVQLVAPNASVWRLVVSNAGVVSTEVVP